MLRLFVTDGNDEQASDQRNKNDFGWKGHTSAAALAAASASAAAFRASAFSCLMRSLRDTEQLDNELGLGFGVDMCRHP